MRTNTLIIGPIGSGKTWCTRTLLAEYPDHEGKIRKGVGLSVRQVSVEPGWEATNGDLTCEMGFHVKEHLAANPGWDETLRWLDVIKDMNADALKVMKIPSSIKQGYNQFMGLYGVLRDYTCQRCGENFGPADSWDESSALLMDGLSGLSKMAVHFSSGPRPTLPWGEIDAAQHHIEGLVDKCTALAASFILIAHWTREPREVEGGTIVTIDTVGQKLAPKLLRSFDEIIVAQRDTNKYTWNLNDNRVDQKARRLPYASNIEPSFTRIFG